MAKADYSRPFDALPPSLFAALEPLAGDIFRTRVELYWADVLRPLRRLYGEREDFDEWAERLLEIVARGYADRPPELRLMDLRRQGEPDWFQQPDMLGYVIYADRFAGDLRGVGEHISYLKEMGVTYLHLMPLLKPRTGANDGGYAVADYRAVNPSLGTMADLSHLAASCGPKASACALIWSVITPPKSMSGRAAPWPAIQSIRTII